VKVLLDTCTIAEIRKPRPDEAVIEALRAIPDEQLFLSVLTVGEIAKGIGLLAAGKKRTELTSWLAGLEGRFSERILPIDAATGRMWGELTARAAKKGHVIATVDGLIAATALRHGLQVMTRNERDFTATGVRVLNPWQET
jgi:predicted nucleic acid-binding protein